MPTDRVVMQPVAKQRIRTRRYLACVVKLSLVSLLLWLNASASLAQTGSSQGPVGPHRPIIVFMTDFGVVDDSVALCKGVMLSIAPDARIVDLTHQVTPFSITDGARFLYGTTPYYPAGTVFVVVIDPGVGTSRKAIVAKTKRGQYFVLPDNGLMTMVADRDGMESAREITNRTWMIGAGVSSTFHGRDIFSPAGAHLSRGDDFTQAGPEIKTLVRLGLKPAQLSADGIHGEVIATDGPFGNLITNVSADDFAKLGYSHNDLVHIKISDTAMEFPFVKTFGEVPLGKALIYIDSRGRFSIALNQDNFAEKYKIRPPVALFIARK